MFKGSGPGGLDYSASADSQTASKGSKEYISLVERTATTHRLTKSQLTQPLTACSVGSYTDGQVLQYTAGREGRGWVS